MELLRYEDAGAGLGAYTKARIRIGDGEQPVEVRIKSDGPTITFMGIKGTAESPPAQRLVQNLTSGVATIRVSVRKDFDHRLANLSLLKSAYLSMFHKFGYEYILRPQLDVVRRQLRCSGEQIVPRAAIFRFTEAPSMGGKRFTSFVIENPSMVIVALDVSTTGQARHCGVMLPSREITEPHIYKIFTDEFAKKYPHMQLSDV